jgi:MFS family permease
VTTGSRAGWIASIWSQNRPVVLLLIVQLLGGIVLLPQRFFFPIYLEEHLGYTAVVVSISVGGALSDALGRKWTLILGLFGFVLGSLLYLVRAPWLVTLLWALSGLGLGFHSLGGQGYLIDAAGSEHLGVVSALYHWGFTLGGALSSPAAGAILDSRGFGAFGWALLLASLATALGATVFLPRLREPAEETPTWNKSLFGYSEIIRRPVVMLLGLLRFLPTCYYGMMTVLIPLLMNRVATNKISVALYATVSQIMATLAQALAGWAADRWGRRLPTRTAFAVLIASAVGLAGFASHLWGLYVFGVLGISAAWSLATLMPCLVSDATIPEERGRVLGTLDLLWNAGMMTGSMIGGALVGIAVGLPFLVAALLTVGAISLTVPFFRVLDREKIARLA